MGSKCKFCVNYHDDFDTNVCPYEIHDACGGFNRFKYFQLASMVEPSSVAHYSYPDAKDNRVMVMGPSELRQALRERRPGKGWRYSNKAAERLIAEQYDLRSKTPVYSKPSGNDALSLIEKAYSKIISLSKGDERWTMSIPADRANDPDIVIGDALIAAREEIAALRAQLAEYNRRIDGYESEAGRLLREKIAIRDSLITMLMWANTFLHHLRAKGDIRALKLTNDMADAHTAIG